MTALCQSTDSSKVTIPTSLNKFYIAKTIQAGLDSISLLDCEQEALMQEFKYQAMESQSDHFYNQLVVATDKVNEGNKVNLRLTNNIKTKNVLLLGLSILTTILIIK
jgi:hypothetical protein